MRPTRLLPLALTLFVGAAALGSVALVPPAAAQQNGAAYLDALRTRYGAARSLRADFTQTMQSAYGGRQTFTGSFLSQGQSYRVDAGPSLFVTDGRTTWLYDRNQNQVVVNRFVADETSFSPVTFFSRYTARYRVTGVTRGGALTTLRLVPRGASEMFDQVTVTLRERDRTVTRLDLRDVNGTQIRYDFRSTLFNPAVPVGSFSFRTPRGAEVVDLRS